MYMYVQYTYEYFCIYSFLLEISLGVVLLVSAAFYINVFIMYSVCTYVTCT